MKYAIVGLGRISPTHLRAAQENRLDIVALCDKNEAKIQKAMQDFHLETSRVAVFTDHRKMLAECRPELVAVATSSGAHASVALDCMESGANVLVEKPIALSLEDADKMIRCAQRKGVKLGVCHQNRFNEAIVKLRDAVEHEALGRLLYGTIQVRWSRGKTYYQQAGWRGTWKEDGGCLMNQCIHGIDLLRWMLGDEVAEVTAVTARLDHPYIEGEDLGMAIVRFQNGSYGMIEGTVNCFDDDFEERLCLFGTDGTVCVGGLATNQIDTWNLRGCTDGEEICREYRQVTKDVYGSGHTLVYRDILSAIAEDRAPAVDGAAGRRALELVLAIYASAQQRRPVQLPLAGGSAESFRSDFGPAEPR